MVAATICELITSEKYLSRSWVSSEAQFRWRSTFIEGPSGPVATQESEYLEFRDSYEFRTLLEEDYPLLEKDIAQWQCYAEWFRKLHANHLEDLAIRGLTPTQDMELWFSGIRENVDGCRFPDKEIDSLRQYGWRLKDSGISNWARSRCFSIHLPRAVPHRREEIANIGRQMCIATYLEYVGKALDSQADGNSNWDKYVFKKLDVNIRIANELVAGTWGAVP